MPRLPAAGALYRGVLDGVDLDLANTRPAADCWSILEYVDHLRNGIRLWRFVVDAAVAEPGIDLRTGGPQTMDPDVKRFGDVE